VEDENNASYLRHHLKGIISVVLSPVRNHLFAIFQLFLFPLFIKSHFLSLQLVPLTVSIEIPSCGPLGSVVDLNKGEEKGKKQKKSFDFFFLPSQPTLRS
jgi:hypothetical protein